jgi:hypothetical protein
MTTVPKAQMPPMGLGMTALVMGTVGLLLCIFPVLGIPISSLGLLLGILAVGEAFRRGGVPLRWALAGVGACVVALFLNFALAYAPADYWHAREGPRMWQTPRDVPFVAPPE